MNEINKFSSYFVKTGKQKEFQNGQIISFLENNFNKTGFRPVS